MFDRRRRLKRTLQAYRSRFHITIWQYELHGKFARTGIFLHKWPRRHDKTTPFNVEHVLDNENSINHLESIGGQIGGLQLRPMVNTTADACGVAAMKQAERTTIARIVKVNHAGEYGAIRIYRSQLWMARRFYPDLVPFLEETLTHEIEHCSLFRSAMPKRAARPCRVMALWGNGGLLLGLFTSMLGRQGVWICTEAVEETVHRHLDEQLHFLRNRDPELYGLIKDIQSEELLHLRHASRQIASRGLWVRSLRALIAGSTEVVIWLSTWGDSMRMARELARSEKLL